jgi:hypothetical protein
MRARAAYFAVKQSWVVFDLIAEIASLPIGTDRAELWEALEKEKAELSRLDEGWKSKEVKKCNR